jgi:hypothetical protein
MYVTGAMLEQRQFCRWRPAALEMAVSDRGLGDAAQGVQMGSSIGTPVVTGLLAAHAASTAAATGTAASILGMAPALAVPVIGAAIVGVTILVTVLLRSGCGQTCVVTSQWANEAEPLLSKNVLAYFETPAPRTRSQQNAALNNFDVVWAALQQRCSQAGLGVAGQNCIADRQAGACKWRQRADSPLLSIPGQPQTGACWNWYSGYRDPIANDPNVVDDPSPFARVGTAVESIFGGPGGAPGPGGISPLMLAVGLGLVVAAGVALA